MTPLIRTVVPSRAMLLTSRPGPWDTFWLSAVYGKRAVFYQMDLKFMSLKSPDGKQVGRFKNRDSYDSVECKELRY